MRIWLRQLENANIVTSRLPKIIRIEFTSAVRRLDCLSPEAVGKKKKAGWLSSIGALFGIHASTAASFSSTNCFLPHNGATYVRTTHFVAKGAQPFSKARRVLLLIYSLRPAPAFSPSISHIFFFHFFLPTRRHLHARISRISVDGS